VANVADGLKILCKPPGQSGPAVLMNIQRQPGANIIGVVDRIKKFCPASAGLPAAVNVSIFTDRTNTIRASVEDVQFSLMLTSVSS